MTDLQDLDEMELIVSRLQSASALVAAHDAALALRLYNFSGHFAGLSSVFRDVYVYMGQLEEPSTLAQDNPELNNIVSLGVQSLVTELISLGITRIASSVGIVVGGPVGFVIGFSAGQIADYLLGTVQFVPESYTASDSVDIVIGSEAWSSYNLLGGNDVFVSRGGTSATVYGGDGSDTIILSGSGDTAYGGAGNDLIIGNLVRIIADGGIGADWIIGSTANDELYGGDGADVLIGGAGMDTIRASGLAAAPDNSTDADRLIGGGGRDTIIGNAGNNVILGDDFSQFSGNIFWFPDLLALQQETSGRYVPLGPGEDDDIEAGAGTDLISGGAGIDRIRGGDHVDYIFGDEGEDQIYGDAGNDVLFGGSDGDRIDGGADYDIAAYWFAEEGIVLDFSNVSNHEGEAAGDTFYSVEEIQASFHDDVIRGGSAAADFKRINGLDGGDEIIGFAGNIDLFGGDGADTLWGGAVEEVVPTGGATTPPTVKRAHLYGEQGDDNFYVNYDPHSFSILEKEQTRPNGIYEYRITDDIGVSRWDNTDVIHDFETGDRIFVVEGATLQGSQPPILSTVDITDLKLRSNMEFDYQSGSFFELVGSDGNGSGYGIAQKGSDAYLFNILIGGEVDTVFGAQAVLQNFSVTTHFEMFA